MAIITGAAVVAMDPSLLPAVDWLGKALFALGVVTAAVPGIRRAAARLRGPHLIFPLLLLMWVWLAAALAGGYRFLGAAAELSLPVVAMVLISVQSWRDRQLRVTAVVGTLLVGIVACTGLASFDRVLNRGAFVHPNGFGATILVLSPFACLALLRGQLLTRAVALLALGLAFIMLLSSSSRASLGAILVFASLVVYLRSGWVARAGLFTATVSLGVSTFALVASMTAAERHAASFEWFGKEVDTGRFGMWALLFRMLVVRPVFGYGPGGSFAPYNDGYSAHSVYFQALFDAGVPALVLLTCSVFFILKQLRSHSIRFPEDTVMNVGLAFMTAMALHGLFEVSWFGNFLPGTFIFWTVAGLLLSRAREYRAAGLPLPQRSRA